MSDAYPPPLPSQPVARSSGMGCFAKGCLVVVAVGVILVAAFAGFSWYLYRSASAFLSQQPVPVRVFPATDEQYNAVLAKLAPFSQALREGRAATVALTADDLNVLIARNPQAAALRGHTYLAIADNQLVADISAPMNQNAPANGTLYFNGRATLEASYSSDDFTFVLRRFEPLTGAAPTGLIGQMTRNPDVLRGFSQGLSQGFNRGFHEQADRNPGTAAVLRRVRTIILQDNQVVLTAAEGQPLAPEAVAGTPKPE